jgi:hypothetical protein
VSSSIDSFSSFLGAQKIPDTRAILK